MGDNIPGETSPRQRESHLGVDAATVLRRPAIVAAVGALFGLGMGIIIGRATVAEPEPAVSPAPAAEPSKSESALTPAAEEDEPEPQRSYEYRVQLGRRVPAGKSGRGFERHRVGSRAVARLVEKEGLISFDVDAKPGEYLLTAVIHFEGKSGKVDTKLDGKPLGSWALEPGWQMYATKVSADRLEQSDHQLQVLAALPAGGDISFDSLATFPVSSEIDVGMGSEAVGLVIDGFAKLGGRAVWSIGARSVIGAALSPSDAPYRLSIRASAFNPIAPLSVGAKVNGKDLGSAELSGKLGDVSWPIEAKLLRDGVNRIEFVYPKTGQPAAVDPASKDKRELAVRFARFELTPNQ